MKKHILIGFLVLGGTLGAHDYRGKAVAAEDFYLTENQKEEMRREPRHIMGVAYPWLEQRRREMAGERDARYAVTDRVESGELSSKQISRNISN